MIKYKHIEAAREIRMWLGQIIVPTTVAILAIPELRNTINNKVREFKQNRNKD